MMRRSEACKIVLNKIMQLTREIRTMNMRQMFIDRYDWYILGMTTSLMLSGTITTHEYDLLNKYKDKVFKRLAECYNLK